MEFEIGETPGPGTYRCTTCNGSVRIGGFNHALPPCGTCGEGQRITYRKA